jgi:PleD family two-component response regulator
MDGLIKAADTAMYEAKRARNSFRFAVQAASPAETRES